MAALRRALLAPGIITPKSHTFRHSWWVRHAGVRPGHATHLLERGQDIRMIQEFTVDSDVKITIFYIHVRSYGVVVVTSSANLLYS
jgi:integrase